MLRFLWGLLVVQGASGAITGLLGNSECPCIDPADHGITTTQLCCKCTHATPHPHAHTHTYTHTHAHAHACTHTHARIAAASALTASLTSCPTGYGTMCKPHDVSVHQDCAVADPPAWCESSWCFVNSKNCAREHHHSDWFPATLNDGGELSWSYVTCGNLDVYSDSVYATARSPRRIFA